MPFRTPCRQTMIMPLLAMVVLMVVSGGCKTPPLQQSDTPSPTPAVEEVQTPTSLALVATASPSATPTVSPTLTASPTHTPTPTSTATPTPTCTPTPTPPPITRFDDALRYHRNGQFDLAIELLHSILEDETAGEIHAEGLFRLGEVHLHAGQFPLAERAFSDFLDRYPDHARQNHATYLIAEALEEQGKLEQALGYFQAYAENNREFTSLLQKKIGDIYMALNEAELAVEAYRSARDAADQLSQRVLYQEDMAKAFLELADYTSALAEYDRILEVATIPSYRCRVQYLAGMAQIKAGEPESAAARFRKAISESEQTSFAHSALVQLLELEVPVNEFQRGMINYHNRSYWPAIAAFDRNLQSETPTRPDASIYYTAASYSGLGLSAEAQVAYQTLTEEYPASPHFGEAWLARARLIGRAGMIATARDLYHQFATEYPAHALAPRALMSRALLSEYAGNLETALAEYLELTTAYPNSESAESARRRAAIITYQLQQYLDAAALWEHLALHSSSSDTVHEALYWSGKCYMIAGELDAAQAKLERAFAMRPLEYYGQRAETLLSKANLLRYPSPSSLEEDPSAQRMAAEEWLSTWSGATLTEIRETIPAAIQAAPALARGRELMAIGLVDEARRELDSLRAGYSERPAHLFVLAVEMGGWPEPRQVILSAQRVIDLSGAALDEIPPAVLKMAYPTFFQDLVENEALERDVDPWLVYSVIRQESLFQSQAISWASAQGLMQVMPGTGEWIAGRLGWRNFTTSDLHLPFINVKFGVYYLQQQLAAFDGDVVSALAAYNAGPGNAARWRSHAIHQDSDLIYALVDFAETRKYLQTVSRNHTVYRHLYASND